MRLLSNMEMDDMAKRGRKPSGKTRAEIQKEYRERANIKNISVDEDTLNLIHNYKSQLEKQLGFELTIKQALKKLIKDATGS